MRLLDLIEKHHAVWLAPNSFGELPALVVTDITWRCADQASDRVLLHIFRHVKAHNIIGRIKQGFRQGASQLRLAHTRRPQKEETTDWTTRIFNPRTRTQDRFGDKRHRFVLSDDTLVQHLAQTE